MKLFISILAIFSLEAAYSQALREIFPLDSAMTNNGRYAIAPQNRTIQIVNDTVLYDAGLLCLSKALPLSSIDSLYAIVDTILYRQNKALFFDTTLHRFVDTMVQIVGFYWLRSSSFADSLLGPDRVLSSCGHQKKCYCTFDESNQGYLCDETMFCNQSGNGTIDWCSNYAYTKVFEDNFEGTALDEKHWFIADEVSSSQASPLGYALFRDVEVSFNPQVQSGTLKLLDESHNTFPYFESNRPNVPLYAGTTYGRIATQTQFGYGKYEIRAKIPEIVGVNPAYWLESSTNDFEIDGFEFFYMNNSNMPTMTVYSRKNEYELPSECQGNGGNPDNRRILQETANRDVWTTPPFPFLHDNQFHIFTLVWDPNYIAWWVDLTTSNTAIPSDNRFVLLYYNTFQSNFPTSDPRSNCSCSICPWQQDRNFPSFTGTANFVLDNGPFTSISTTGGPSQTGPYSGTTSYFEIDWVKIYQRDNCNVNINLPTQNGNHVFRFTDNGNQNAITGDNITFAGPNGDYTIAFASFDPNNADATELKNESLFARANNEIQILNGFSAEPGSVFEATIAFNGNNQFPADCSNFNDFENQNNRVKHLPPTRNVKTTYSTDSKPPQALKTENKNSNFNLYPNPSQIEINLTGGFNCEAIEILTSQNALVRKCLPDERKINVSGLNPGLYFIRISSEKKVQIIKFIKE